MSLLSLLASPLPNKVPLALGGYIPPLRERRAKGMRTHLNRFKGPAEMGGPTRPNEARKGCETFVAAHEKHTCSVS